MSKFKVGDRVRVIDGDPGWIGNVGIVTDVDDPVIDSVPYRVELDGYAYGHEFFGDSELIPETIVAQRPVIAQAVDVVNHPAHYNRFPVEVINITEQLDFNRGNAVKYLARAGYKDGVDELEDLSKAAWYVNRAIEKLTKERTG